MELFLMIASMLFLIFGTLLLLSPSAFEKVSNFLNRKAFFVSEDKVENVSTIRRAVGISLLALSIILWYISFPGPR